MLIIYTLKNFKLKQRKLSGLWTTKQKILGLNSDGTLLVENINGITESISSGEIAFINN